MRTSIAAIAFVAWFGCGGGDRTERLAVDTKTLPTQQSWNTSVTFSDSGRTRAVLHAGHIAMYEVTRTTEMDSGVHVDFFSALGVHSSVLTSKTATVDDRTKDMTARGGVVVVSDSGVTVTTEILHWDNARRKINSDQFVRIVSPNEVLQGYGFEADQDLRNYVIYRISGQQR